LYASTAKLLPVPPMDKGTKAKRSKNICRYLLQV
jgi:hypothetical protein